MFIKGRLNRRDYEAMLPVPAQKKTFADAMAMIRRTVKRAAIAAGHIEDPATKRPKWDWHWSLPTYLHNYLGDDDCPGGIVAANTKGEARSLIKKALGTKHALPSTIHIIRVAPNANPPALTLPNDRLADAG